jgi:Mn2+/Fe2+ NRAMP family transporter
VGRYRLIQSLSTVLVASFTLLTILNLFLLQREPAWRVDFQEFLSGLTLGLPASDGNINPIGTALATFGIIGVGAAELVVYPYWCLEKGYARFTGHNDGSAAWQARAAGWMRVMRFDAWGAMAVYTFSTVAFYLLGAAVLHRVGLNPEKSDMVRTLAVMFVPVFSDWASAVFLFGAIAVLYSTFFVANASHARVFSDALRVIGLIEEDEQTRERWVRGLSGFFPILCVIIYLLYQAPAQLVLISGIAQGIMLPMLAGAALFFRYRRCVPGLRPGRLWDVMLWLSAAAMLVTGGWTVIDQLRNHFN